jgi:multimeric flavodoxin WrbA
VSRALITYYSKTGHTKQAGEDSAEGLREAGVEVTLKPVTEVEPTELAGYDLIVIGSPCHAGSMRVLFSGIAGPVSEWLGALPWKVFAGKAVAAFSVHCSLGAKATVQSLQRLLTDMGGRVLIPGPAVKAGAPLSLWRGPDASPEDRENLRHFGRDLARELASGG